MLIILLNAARSVSVMLFASPQSKNNDVTRIKGIRLPGAINFSFTLEELISGGLNTGFVHIEG